MKKYYLIIGVIVAMTMISGCKQTEKTESITADIEAAQMQGREAARWFLNQSLSDSLSNAQKAVEARKPKEELERQGKKEAAAAFDSAFVKTVRAVNPKLKY